MEHLLINNKYFMLKWIFLFLKGNERHIDGFVDFMIKLKLHIITLHTYSYISTMNLRKINFYSIFLELQISYLFNEL